MTEHVDVLIVGAGLSGIGAACHLEERLPGTSYLVLEARQRDGRHLGPVPLPRHPVGLRHVHARLPVPAVDRREGDRRRPVDPDLRARDRARARRRATRSATALRVERAEWSTDDATWTVHARARRRAGHVHLRLPVVRAAATTPTTRVTRRTSTASTTSPPPAGRSCTPSSGPSDLDYAGKRVVVIGSGATAVTLVPALARGEGAAAHVTMLQRSPTYVLSLPGHRQGRRRAARAAAGRRRRTP